MLSESGLPAIIRPSQDVKLHCQGHRHEQPADSGSKRNRLRAGVPAEARTKRNPNWLAQKYPKQPVGKGEDTSCP